MGPSGGSGIEIESGYQLTGHPVYKSRGDLSLLKLRYCEEANRFERKNPTFLCLLNNVKTRGGIFSNFVALSENLNCITQDSHLGREETQSCNF